MQRMFNALITAVSLTVGAALPMRTAQAVSE